MPSSSPPPTFPAPPTRRPATSHAAPTSPDSSEFPPLQHAAAAAAAGRPLPPAHALAAPSHPDPYPWYDGLLGGPPLVFDAPRGLWLASRADVVRSVMADPACRVRPAAEPVPRAIDGMPAGELFARLVRMNDGPLAHDLPKGVIQRLLAGADLARLRRRTGAIARETAGDPAALHGGRLTAWTWAVPVMAVADWLGVARGDLAEVARLTGDFVACLSPLGTPAQLEAASAAAAALMSHLERLLSAAPPGSPLALAREGATRAGWHDARGLLANLAGLLSQTCEATAGLLGNSVVALARRPELLAAAPGVAARWLPLVSETSRHDPAIHNTRRFVAEATTIAGVRLQAGDAVLLVLAAAGRDPRLHEQPDTVPTDCRPPAPHDIAAPAFGHGAHQCPGQAMACTVAAAALEAVWGSGGPTPPLPAAWHYRTSLNARIPVFTP